MITVRPVKGRRDLKKFIAFPNKLFKDVPTYIPALNFDEVNLLTCKNLTLDITAGTASVSGSALSLR